jgi:Domain of unknown function (DUF4352)
VGVKRTGFARVGTWRAAIYAGMIIASAIALFAPAPIAVTSFADNAQPLGQPLSTIIIFGDQYNGGDELYDAKITVMQVVRGEKAWRILKAISTSNPPPKSGFEYLLARIHFEFSARTSPSRYNYIIDESQFTATSTDGTDYAPAHIAEQPIPNLDGTLKPGNSLEGWVTFIVPQGDRKPLMLFRENVGSVFHEGGGSFFELYDSNLRR